MRCFLLFESVYDYYVVNVGYERHVTKCLTTLLDYCIKDDERT